MNKEPLITVIIPTFNSMLTIHRCLESLRHLKYENKEIIFVDDGSMDGTCEFLKTQSDIILIESQNQGPSRARNLGLLIAKGDFVAFTDSDCVLKEDWLNELLKGFIEFEKDNLLQNGNQPKIAGVGGDQLSPTDETLFGKKVQKFLKRIGIVADYVKRGGERIFEIDHNPTCNIMYRRLVLIEAEGFDESLWPGEDLEMDSLLRNRGYKILYNPRAIVYHYRPNKVKGFLKMLFHYGRAQGVLVRRKGMFRFLHYIASILTLLFIIFICFLFIKTALALTLLFLIFLGILGGAIFSSKNSREGIEFFLMFISAVSHWFAGFYYGLVTNNGLPSTLSPPTTSIYNDPALDKYSDLFKKKKKSKPFISILFPNWNGCQDTIECLDSIAKLNYPKYRLEIIITDNGSTDGSQKTIKEKFTEMRKQGFSRLYMIENEENEGAVKAYNQAYDKAYSGRDFVLKLDNDIELHPEAINHLLKVFDEDSRAGIVGGEIHSAYEKNKVVHSAGFCFFPLAIFPSMPKKKRTTCGYVTGCCALIKQSVLNKIGYFLDEKYFVYHDDVDLCLTAKRQGWKIVYEPKAVIYHKVGRSTERPKRSPFAMYYDFRNKLYLISKHCSKLTVLIFYFLLPVNILYFFVRYRCISPMMRGFFDYLNNNMGSGSLK